MNGVTEDTYKEVGDIVVRFNNYRQFEIPQMFVCNPGCKLKNGMLTNVAGALPDASDTELVFNFNAASALSFRVYKQNYEEVEESIFINKLYNSLKNKRLIYLDKIGFFVISEVVSSFDEGLQYKDIKAESCEIELRSKAIPYIEDKTYKFMTNNASDPGMLELLISASPLWQIGHVDLEVANRWRTFEEVDYSNSVLSFLLNDIQDAYECLVIFDIMTRQVNVYDKANYVKLTNIHISNEDLITKLDMTESSDDLYTALSVTGGDQLTINAINPLGTNVIYNFDYYLDWMTPALREKVEAWQTAVKNNVDPYYNLQNTRYSTLTTRSNMFAEYEKVQTQLSMYKKCKENIIAESSAEDVSSYNDVIVQVGGIPIPEESKYTWIKYADDQHGTHMTEDPYGKNYIGIAHDKASRVASNNPADYIWSTFRNGEALPYTVNGDTRYIWIVFTDSIFTGMSSDPDEKKYIGIAIDKTSATKSDVYEDYSYMLLNTGNFGFPQVLTRIVALIEETSAELDAKQSALDEIDAVIDRQEAEIQAMHNSVDMQQFFTTDEMDELSNYISQGGYTDEYITVTESMTYSERFAQMKLLYDRAVDQLKRISNPTQEFEVDVQNFIFAQEFEEWSDQLETGCIINVEVEEGDIAQLFLSSFTVNYTDKTLKMTFGNRYNRFDPQALFDDVLGGIERNANTIAYLKELLFPIKQGELNSMQEALSTFRDISKTQVLASTNEQVIIDDTGYTGRRRLEDGTLDPKQIKINGRNIVFTDDAWETCKTAIGEIVFADDDSRYGVNAEVLLGDLIVGNELHILNSRGEDMFSVTEDNVIIKVGESFASKEDAIRSVDVEYCRATSNVSPLDPDTITVDWNTVAPQWVNDEYMWQRTVTTYDDNTVFTTDPTCLTGSAGTPGMGVASVQIAYVTSEDGQTPPTEGWSDQIPTLESGSYLWTRSIFIYDDGTSSAPTYSVGSSGVGISSIVEEYNLSTSNSEPDGLWTSEPPAFNNGQFIWTRSRIIWDNGTETTTEPVLNMTWNNLGNAIDSARTEIEINKNGIQQNTEYYQELSGQLSKINAYIQTGVISVDEEGRTSFGVKIGENLAAVDTYIVPDSTPLSAGWLSDSVSGEALVPMEAVIYLVKTPGAFYNKSYRWTGDSYEEANSEGTLSSIFTSSELGFYDTGEKTAYFSNKNLNVRTVRTSKLLLSEDVIGDISTNNWQIGIDNGFYLKWIGG